MQNGYLRKIILEELQKVLKEEFNPSLEVYKSGQNRAKGYPFDTDLFGGQGPIDPSRAPLGSPLNPRESAPHLDPQYVRSKPKRKRRPLKKSFTEKEIVDLSLNPKRIYSGHKAQYKTASGEVYSIKFDRTGKPDYGTIALLSAPKSEASVSPDLSDKDVEGSVSFDPASESETDLKRVRGEIQPTFEESGLSRQEYDQCLALGNVRQCMQSKGIEPIDESIRREINKLLKML